MKVTKKKFALGVLLITATILGAMMYQPATFEAISESGKRIHAERSSVIVPSVREDQTSDKLKVKYVKLKSFSKQPEAPIFFLAGGPGQGATWQSEHNQLLDYWSAFLKTRDVILIDQRGTGTSAGSGLGRLKLLWIKFGWPANDVFVSEEAAIAHFLDMGHKASKAFLHRGIALNGYNSKESAHDIDAIREQMGYDKIIPMGFSYGSHLGQAYIKYYEDRVEKTILIGVEGMDDTFKLPSDLDHHFRKFAKIVEADSSLNKQIPDFIGLYNQAVEKLEANPIAVEITTPIKLKRKVLIGKFGLDYILKRDMGDAYDLPYFPRLLYSIVHGDGAALKWYVEKRFQEFMGIPAMMVSMDMASGVSPDRKRKIINEEAESMFGKVANLPFIAMHGQWPVKDLGDDYRAPVSSDVPALLLSGSLDINTPSYQADRVLRGFPNGIHIQVKNAGHEQIQYHRMTTKTILDFLNDEDVSDVKIAYPNLKFKELIDSQF